jgi:hypothetical protein
MFKQIQEKVKKQFEVLVATGNLYYVEVDKEAIWQKYLDAFPEADRASNICNCCRSFIRQYAGVVALNKNQEVMTLWDFEAKDAEYDASIKVLRDYVKSLPIAGIFYSPVACAGTEKNADKVRNLIWHHYHLNIPKKFVNANAGPLVGSANDDKNVLERSLNQITDEAVDTVLELIAQKSLYRGNEHEATLKSFKSIKNEYKQYKGNKKNFCWAKSLTVNKAVCRIRNSAIGTLLNDLSEGRELDSALTAFEKVVAPSNYKRPTAIATPAMIEKAKARLQELGMIGSLQRRQLSTTDLNVSNSLYVYRPMESGVEVDLFAEIKKDTVVNPKSLSKVEEIGIEDFVNKVLPTCKSVRVLLENHHLNNFVSLVGPKSEDHTNMFKWGNSFGWSYSGAVADSMKARVVELGGRVDGVLRFTHSWNHPEMGRNSSLMDLHVFLPGSSVHKDGCHNTYPNGQRVGWNSRKDIISGGIQDVDYTTAAPEGYIPVENITFPDIKKLKDGKYTFKIHNWQARDPNKSGFRAEIEFGGELYQFERAAPLNHHEWVTLAEVTLSKGQFTMDSKIQNKPSRKTKWNLETLQYHNVSAITFSPNCWGDKAIGNKQYMFFLENCKADEKVLPFYNEFLKPELNEDRKVFEMLANKAVVEPVENELSGIGFSDSVRNHVILEITGQFKRHIKVLF